MKRCLVTGAAAGIGRAVAARFARDGHELLGLDVDVEAALDTAVALEAEGARVRFQEADLSRGESIERALDGLEALRAEGPLDVVVHNAGINHVGPFATSDWDPQRRVLDVNLLAPLLLTQGLLSRGLLARDVSIVFVSSLSHFVGYPGAAAYAASKDGLASYAASLHTLLEPRGGHVLTVYPGPTRTEHARRYSPDNAREDRRMPPEELAERIHQALRRRRRVLVPGVSNHLFAAFGHLLPRVSEKAMRRAIYDRLT